MYKRNHLENLVLRATAGRCLAESTSNCNWRLVSSRIIERKLEVSSFWAEVSPGYYQLLTWYDITILYQLVNTNYYFLLLPATHLSIRSNAVYRGRPKLANHLEVHLTQYNFWCNHLMLRTMKYDTDNQRRITKKKIKKNIITMTIKNRQKITRDLDWLSSLSITRNF